MKMIRPTVFFFLAWMQCTSTFGASSGVVPEALPWQAAVLDVETRLWIATVDHCDVDVMREVMADDIEWINSRVGIVEGKEAVIRLTLGSSCSRPAHMSVLREERPGSMKMVPLRQLTKGNDVLAVLVTGISDFTTTMKENGTPFRTAVHFSHVLVPDHGKWRVWRATSYVTSAKEPEY